GRKKDLIVTAEGMNVHPSDIEAALTAIDGVNEAVAFARPGPRGEEVHASILPAREGLDAEDVLRAANGGLLPHQRIRALTIWSGIDFPRTATGKIRRRDVASASAAEGAAPATAGRAPSKAGPD